MAESSAAVRPRDRLLGLRFGGPKAGSSPAASSSRTADLPFSRVRL